MTPRKGRVPRFLPGSWKQRKGVMSIDPPVSHSTGIALYEKLKQFVCSEFDLPVGNKLCDKTREFVRRVDIFSREICSVAPSLGSSSQFTANIVGIGRKTVEEIVNASLEIDVSSPVSPSRAVYVLPHCSPRTSVPLTDARRREKILLKYPTYVLDKIMRVVRSSWKTGRTVTLNYLNQLLKDDLLSDDFARTSSRSHLCKILKCLGFKYGRIYDRAQLYEKPALTIWRHRFLKRMKELRESDAFIAYSDETWIFSGMKGNKAWQEPSALENPNQMRMQGYKVGPDPAPSKGERAIVIGTICETGIVPNSFEVIGNCGTAEDGDYHRRMNAEVFENYLHQVLPEIASMAGNRQPVFVMDNARYHLRISEEHKIPSQASRKQVLLDFLLSKKITCSPTMKKPELVQLLNRYLASIGGREQATVYMVDLIAAQYEVIIVRLPPYHCCLNPIEYFWGWLKRQICAHSSPKARIEALQKTAVELISKMPDDMKLNFFNKGEKEEKDFIKRENIQNFIDGTTDQVKPVIIPIEDEDDEDDFDQSELNFLLLTNLKTVFYAKDNEEQTTSVLSSEPVDINEEEELRQLLELMEDTGEKFNTKEAKRQQRYR